MKNKICKVFGHKIGNLVYEGFFKDVLKQYECPRCGKLFWLGPMGIMIDDDDPRLSRVH